MRDLVLPFLDLGVVELLDASALHADEMVVMLAFVQLEDRLAGFEMVTNQKPGLLKLRQHAINGRETDVETFGQELFVDIFGGQMPHLGRLEQVDDLDAWQRGLEAGAFEVVR